MHSCANAHTDTHTPVAAEVTGWLIPVYLAMEIKAHLEKHKKWNNTLKMLLCWGDFCFRFNHSSGINKLAKCCLFCHCTPIFVPLERNLKTGYPGASHSNVWINRAIKSQNNIGWRGSLEVHCSSHAQGRLRASFSWLSTVPKAGDVTALPRTLFWCCSALRWTAPGGVGRPSVPAVAENFKHHWPSTDNCTQKSPSPACQLRDSALTVLIFLWSDLFSLFMLSSSLFMTNIYLFVPVHACVL